MLPSPEGHLVRACQGTPCASAHHGGLLLLLLLGHLLLLRHLLLLLHVCRKWNGAPRPIEAAALKWVRPVELHALDMPAPDRPLIGLLEALV